MFPTPALSTLSCRFASGARFCPPQEADNCAPFASLYKYLSLFSLLTGAAWSFWHWSLGQGPHRRPEEVQNFAYKCSRQRLISYVLASCRAPHFLVAVGCSGILCAMAARNWESHVPFRTVSMPKAKFGFRRSNPFELKLFEAQDQCDIRHKSAYMISASQVLPRWSLMTMGQSR